jgi:hypothetical protein
MQNTDNLERKEKIISAFRLGKYYTVSITVLLYNT